LKETYLAIRVTCERPHAENATFNINQCGDLIKVIILSNVITPTVGKTASAWFGIKVR